MGEVPLIGLSYATIVEASRIDCEVMSERRLGRCRLTVPERIRGALEWDDDIKRGYKAFFWLVVVEKAGQQKLGFRRTAFVTNFYSPHGG